MTHDPRIDLIVELVTSLASGRRDSRVEPTGADDELDAVIVGLNMLGEELDARQAVVERGMARADRLAGLGQLAAGVAHEVNNPLSYVTANLDLVREELDALAPELPEERLQEIVAMVDEARVGASRVRRIVRELKTYARVDIDTLAPVDIHRAIESAEAMSANEIRHVARLEKDLGQVPSVLASESRLVQVFTNLLVNAVAALPHAREDENRIRVVARTDGERAVIEVHDNGSGIPEDVVAHIFDPFFTTKAVGKGTGLGLFVAHGIVASLGGALTVSTALGIGSTFTVSLPGAKGVMGEAKKPSPTRVAADHRAKVLVIDDDPMVGRSLERALGKVHEVRVITDAREALAHCLLESAGFDMIFCDLMMPGMNGMELYDELRNGAPKLAERVVFITGGAFSRAAVEFVEATSRPVVDKPFDIALVRELVRSFVANES